MPDGGQRLSGAEYRKKKHEKEAVLKNNLVLLKKFARKRGTEIIKT